MASVRAQTRTEPEHPKLVRAQGGRLVAVVDLIVERGDAELYFAAGFELPPELTDLPRRAAA